MFVDAHCHLDWFNEPEAAVREAGATRVKKIVSCSTNLLSIQKHILLAQEFSEIEICLGIHPADLLSMPPAEIEKARALVSQNIGNAAGIGEVGLDFMRAKSGTEKKLQAEAFGFFAALAKKASKPVVVHSRNSDSECLSMLEGLGCRKVLLHWCTNSAETVKRASALGYFMSAGPAIISGKKASSVAKEIPPELLLLETDAPVAFSGKQSSPAWIPLVAEKIAELHSQSISRVEEQTTANAERLFRFRASKKG
ncbi:MAG: TatD family hydrolase [Candidatus Diapherotrites archaeon]|nr:TatD family hydrolase [Candidatus Diapherotrites archaeon]